MIPYKGIYLHRSSEAYRLFKEGQIKELDKLIQETAKKEQALIERYSRTTLPEELRTASEASHTTSWDGLGC